MAPPFRRRVLRGLIVLGTIPLAVALGVLVLQVRSTVSPAGPLNALEEIAETGRTLASTVDSTRLEQDERAALTRHLDAISERTVLARRAQRLSRTAAAAMAAAILVAGSLVIAMSVHLAHRWSGFVSAPIEELSSWVRSVEERRPLPQSFSPAASPEFVRVSAALKDAAIALERARRAEIERERLEAFRELARSVAHEIRGPVTASQLALANLVATGSTSAESAPAAVLRDELERLDGMAREFAEFGRLAEGPVAKVDLGALLEDVARSVLSNSRSSHCNVEEGLTITGRYEPLRRAFHNLLTNAVEASPLEPVEISARAVPADPDTVEIKVEDRGPGIDENDIHKVFEPYFTTKSGGTGLGLALVRQTIISHHGTIGVSNSPSGGAVFTVRLPSSR